MYDGMKVAGLKPDAVTFSYQPVHNLAALEKGKEIHNCVSERGFENNEMVMGALLGMYAKCGAVSEAFDVFDKLPEGDLVSWTSMITAYGSHGQASKALRLFDEMLQSNAKPDSVITFLAVLSDCSHSGLLDKGYNYFNEITTKYGIKPRIEHYSCLIDLLGRAGRLHEAYRILQNTPEIAEDVGLLGTLFSACHLQKDLELGEGIAKLLIKKDPDTYVTLSNMYASLKKRDKARMVRLKMKELGLGLKKNPGCSWIEIDRRIQPFFVEDQSHPEAKKVNDCLAILTRYMEKDEMLHLKNHAGPILEVSVGLQIIKIFFQ